MPEQPITWSDDAQSVFDGDLVAAFAYLTPAGGAVVVPVSPLGLVDRGAGTISMTTSLAFPRKLERLLREPRVAMAYHAREHGFATTSSFVLAQGDATVALEPSPERLAAIEPHADRFFGVAPTGPFWNWALREYLEQRLIVDISVGRVVTWPDPQAGGDPSVFGTPRPTPAAPQKAPANGRGPRIDQRKLFQQARKLRHHVLSYRGDDGFPVIVPIRVSGHSEHGLHLRVAPGLLPPGGRRAGVAMHSFRPWAAGVATRIGTGWLEVRGGEAIWAPHTASGFSSPPNKTLHLLGNGLLSKYNFRRVSRDGTLEQLASARRRASG